MSQWTPCKRRDFIRKLRKLGFDGPLSGKRHQFMVYGSRRLAIPSGSEYSIAQLKTMIREVEGVVGRSVPADRWNAL